MSLGYQKSAGNIFGALGTSIDKEVIVINLINFDYSNLHVVESYFLLRLVFLARSWRTSTFHKIG